MMMDLVKSIYGKGGKMNFKLDNTKEQLHKLRRKIKLFLCAEILITIGSTSMLVWNLWSYANNVISNNTNQTFSLFLTIIWVILTSVWINHVRNSIRFIRETSKLEKLTEFSHINKMRNT